MLRRPAIARVNGTDAIIVGAGPAGLACAVTMRAAGLRVEVLEQAGSVASSWRRHYDRLHLHTDRGHSGLPGMPMPTSFPRYPSRADVVAYLEAYAATFDVHPVLGKRVAQIRREGALWRVEAGAARFAPVVVVATGIAGAPHRPSWPGMASFRGSIVHSSDYRNAQRYRGQRVLVVGFGNSGAEIALDLADAGVAVTLAVRGPVQVLPLTLFGLPILSWAILYRHLPARLVDAINAPVLRRVIGPLEPLGLRLAREGPRQMIATGRVPVIDIGTLQRIREGAIAVRGAVDRFTPEDVVFADGHHEPFDAMVLATGFRPDLRSLLPDATDVLDARGMPRQTGRTTGAPGLYFCGHIPSPTGQLREISIEARRIARLARAHVAGRPPSSSVHDAGL